MQNIIDEPRSKFYNYQFKIILIGDIGTGKSCMRLQLVEKRLPEVYEKTNYIEYAAKTLDVGNKKIKLEIWDYGENAFRNTLIPATLANNCIGVVLVFSIISRESFKVAQDWLQNQRSRCHPFTKVFLVGSKADESYIRTVTREEATNLAHHYSIEYTEISAKQYSDVYALFRNVAQTIYHDVESGRIPANYKTYGVREFDDYYSGFTLSSSPRVRKSNCC